jgi:cell division protein FtsQ
MSARRIFARKRPRPNRYKRTPFDWSGLFHHSLRIATLGFLVAGLAASFILVHDIATQSRRLAAHQVRVIGNRHLDEMTVMRQAGVHPGINILAVRLGECRTRLLAHPWIAQASVGRQLPDRIEIRIAEHRPVAMVEIADGRFLIDAAGRPFKRWRDGDPDDLPVIRGLNYADLPALEPPETPLLATAIDALNHWRQSARYLAAQRNPIHLVADRDTGLSIETGSALGTVVLGYGHYRKKFDNLSQFMNKIANQGTAGWLRIDLTHLQRIVVRPSHQPEEV